MAAGIWFGLKTWAGPRDRVTLHVKNMPLAQVVQIIEDQIQEKVRVDQKLTAKVTLDVKNMPLTNVLELLAVQAGARWGKTYAVYTSAGALDRLDGVFAGGSTLEAEGWTNLAPHFTKTELPGIAASDRDSDPGRIMINPPAGSNSGKAFTVQNEEDVQNVLQDKTQNRSGSAKGEEVVAGPGGEVVVRKLGPGDGSAPVKRHIMVRVSRGADGITTSTTTMDGAGERVSVTKSSPGGRIVEEDDWSRERLVIETPLSERLEGTIPETATREIAAETTAKVNGRLATYYQLDKPPLGGDFRALGRSGNWTRGGDTNNPMAALGAEQEEMRLGGLGKLSPEEQVQRARRSGAANDTGK